MDGLLLLIAVGIGAFAYGRGYRSGFDVGRAYGELHAKASAQEPAAVERRLIVVRGPSNLH